MSKNKWDQRRYQELIDLHKALSLLSLEGISAVLVRPPPFRFLDRLFHIIPLRQGQAGIEFAVPQSPRDREFFFNFLVEFPNHGGCHFKRSIYSRAGFFYFFLLSRRIQSTF